MSLNPAAAAAEEGVDATMQTLETGATAAKLDSGDLCGAMCRSGKACANRRKVDDPDLGPLCGVHLRSARTQTECSICLGSVRVRHSKRLECGHCFHRRCIRTWFGRGSLTCPLCRSVCLAELGSSHPLLSGRVRHLVRLVPPPRGVFFAAYMLGLLNSPPVVGALGLSDEQAQLLVELAYQSFTQEHFFQYLRQLNL